MHDDEIRASWRVDKFHLADEYEQRARHDEIARFTRKALLIGAVVWFVVVNGLIVIGWGWDWMLAELDESGLAMFSYGIPGLLAFFAFLRLPVACSLGIRDMAHPTATWNTDHYPELGEERECRVSADAQAYRVDERDHAWPLAQLSKVVCTPRGWFLLPRPGAGFWLPLESLPREEDAARLQGWLRQSGASLVETCDRASSTVPRGA